MLERKEVKMNRRKRKLLTLNDLYDFFVNQGTSYAFNSKDSDSTIIVQVEEQMNFGDSEEYDPSFGMLKAHLQSCHILENRNHSFISKKSMRQAIPSFYNRPILGYIHQLKDGSWDFAGHEFASKDGEPQEYPIGVIPESCNAQLVYDEEKEKTYLEVDGLIYENYSRAADILREKKESKVSVEISVDEMSYSADDKILNIEKFHFMGVTILGKSIETESVIEEGMQGSNITLADFSKENNSLIKPYEEELLKVLNDINDTLSSFQNKSNNVMEGGNLEVSKFEELLSKYNKTAEDITFEVEGLSDEELEAKFEETFKEEVDEVTETNEVTEDNSIEEETTDNSIEDETVEVEEGDTETKEDNIEEDVTEEDNSTEDYSLSSTVKFGDKEYSFSISLNEKIYALTQLVNETYADSDNSYYSVEVYDKEVVMIDYWTGRAYRQSYKVRQDTYSLTGDRVSVYAKYLTKDEEKALDELRGNYSSISEQLEECQKKLDSYEYAELRSKKESLLTSEDYSVLSEDETFKELVKNMDNYSLEELNDKADLALAKFVKTNKTFAANSENKSKKSNKVTFSLNEEPVDEKPYGDLFEGIK